MPDEAEFREHIFEAFGLIVGDFDRDGLELTMIEVGVDLDEVGAALLAGDVDKANSILAQGQERLRRWGQEIQGD